jgi:hypothetical protein
LKKATPTQSPARAFKDLGTNANNSSTSTPINTPVKNQAAPGMDKENAANTFGKSQIPVRVRPKQDKVEDAGRLKIIAPAIPHSGIEREAGGPSPVKMQGLSLFSHPGPVWREP